MEQERKDPVFKWLGLLVTSLALAIIVIDTTVLNVSLRNIMQDLHADLQTMQWIITIYSLILAALTITGGRLGDLFGRKKMFVLGALLFGIGSFIASISTSAGMLLFGWSVIEGIGAALMMPATASMVISTFQGKERAIAFGIWGGVAGAASAFGPLLGGYLTANVSWHWAFRINVFVVALVVFGSLILKESIDKKEKHTLDIVGSLLSGLSMASIVYGIVESSTYGWLMAKKVWEIGTYAVSFGGLSVTPVAVALGLVLLVLFVLWERYMESQNRTPLVSVAIFKNRQFVVGILVTSIMALGQAGIIFAIPVFLQAVIGLDAFETGKGLLPMSLSLLVVAPLSGFLRKVVKTRDLIQIGLFLSALGAVVLYYSITVTSGTLALTPGLLLLGAGMGLTMSQISNVTLSAIDPNMAGEASGINNTIRQLGGSLGSALIGAVFLTTLTTTMVTGVTNSQVIPETVKQVIIDKVQNDSSSIELGGDISTSSPNMPKTLAAEIVSVKNDATVSGSKNALLLTAGFSVLSLFASFLLPREMKERTAGSGHGPMPAGH